MKRFVIEAVMAAVYGQLLAPDKAVEFIIPYSSISELYELQVSAEPIMSEDGEEAHVRGQLNEMIAFLEAPLNKKKLERALTNPWVKSPSILLNDKVSFTIINSYEDAQYGELFDPVETELILVASREQAPILTDQIEFIEKVLEGGVPVQVYDIEDFEFAVEGGISLEED
jgi:hypothetical protein